MAEKGAHQPDRPGSVFRVGFPVYHQMGSPEAPINTARHQFAKDGGQLEAHQHSARARAATKNQPESDRPPDQGFGHFYLVLPSFEQWKERSLSQ